jgi:TolB-like protein
MEDVQLPEGPVAAGGSDNSITDETVVRPNGSDTTAADQVGENVILPQRPLQDRSPPFRLMPGGAHRDRDDTDIASPNHVSEATQLPGQRPTTRHRATATVVAPVWGTPWRMIPDGTAPHPGRASREPKIVPPWSGSDGQTAETVGPGWDPGRTETTQAIAQPLVSRRQSRSTMRLGIREMRVIGPNVDQALSVGLAEEVTIALSRFRWISCVSGSSLATLAGECGEASVRWPDLDLDLLLDGTIQHGSGRVRITVRLLDMQAGEAVIWANRFDHDASDTLTVQDRVASAIVAQVDPMLLIREGERAANRNPRGVTARDLVLRAIPAIYRMDRLSFHAAGELLEAALRDEPTHTDALAWYAYWHLFLVGQGWTDEPGAATRRAGELADTAVALAPNDARALTLASHVRAFLLKRAAEAAVLHDRAISLNPNLAIAWCFSGFTLSYLGDHEAALVRMAKAIELSPSDPHLFFFHAAIIMPHLLLGRYQEAAEAGRRAIELNPWFSSAFKGCLSALGHLGLAKEAAGVLSRLVKLEPDFTVQDAVRRSPMTVAADIEQYADGLRRAGLPEG